MNNSIKQKSLKKWTNFIIVDLLLICLVSFVIYIFHSYNNNDIEGVFIQHPREIADFNLIDQYGHSFTKAQLKGHWTLLFFGFTHCAMICPSTFDALNKMYLLLQKQLPAELLPLVVFVSLDPERDSVERLKYTINYYNKHFVGVKAELTHVYSLEKELSLSKKHLNELFDHTTDIIVLNKNADIQAYFLYPHRPNSMAKDYRLLIEAA